ncbi:MAG: hypothetical protein HY700_12080 [Gemmatimonadetes bacterium]|nr:hypothetical protein [Gemmatimonadota bacterium]
MFAARWSRLALVAVVAVAAAACRLELPAYDSGGDDGTTYKAPDKDNNPKKPTSKAMTPHFVINRVVVPVATVTLTKK